MSTCRDRSSTLSTQPSCQYRSGHTHTRHLCRQQRTVFERVRDMLSTCLRPARACHASLRPGFRPGFRPARLMEFEHMQNMCALPDRCRQTVHWLRQCCHKQPPLFSDFTAVLLTCSVFTKKNNRFLAFVLPNVNRSG